MKTVGVRSSPRRKGKAKGCGKRVSDQPDAVVTKETNLSGTKPQPSRIATLMLKKFGIDVLTLVGNSKAFEQVDAHTTRLDNVPLVLPLSICSGVRPLDVGIAVAEKIGYDVASALLWSSNPNSLLSRVVMHHHILPPSLAPVPRLGNSELVSFWSEMYGSILRRTRSFRLLERIFLNKLVFKDKDHLILVRFFDDFGIIAAEPFKKCGVKIMIGDLSIGVSARDYGFLQTFFFVDNWGTIDGGTMEKMRKFIQ